MENGIGFIITSKPLKISYCVGVTPSLETHPIFRAEIPEVIPTPPCRNIEFLDVSACYPSSILQSI